MRGGKCRSLNSIIYGIIILVRFICISYSTPRRYVAGLSSNLRHEGA